MLKSYKYGRDGYGKYVEDDAGERYAVELYPYPGLVPYLASIYYCLTWWIMYRLKGENDDEAC